MATTVAVQGVAEARRHLEGMAEAAKAAGGRSYLVGSGLAYAYGIETGRHRGGRLARRAGGAHMLQRALDSVAPSIPAAVARALPRGAGAVDQALRKIAFEVESRAKAQTPVRSSALRASIHVSGRVG